MASKVALIVKAREALDSLDNLEEEDLLNKVIENIPEKFRHNFIKLADCMIVDNLEFLAYWESDEGCQKAFRELMQRRINGLEKMIGIMKDLIA